MSGVSSISLLLLPSHNGERIRLSSSQAKPVNIQIGDTSQTWVADTSIEVLNNGITYVTTFVASFGATVNFFNGNTIATGEYGRVTRNADGSWDLHIYKTPSASGPTVPGVVNDVMLSDGAGALKVGAMSMLPNDGNFTTYISLGDNAHGNVNIYSPNTNSVGSGNGANFSINAGHAPYYGDGFGGQLNLIAGDGSKSGASGKFGGDVQIRAGARGDSTAQDQVGGSVRITSGASDLNAVATPFIALETAGSSAVATPTPFTSLVLNQFGALGWAASKVNSTFGATYGTAGQLLQSNGSSAQPSWVNAPSGGGGSGLTINNQTVASYALQLSDQSNTVIRMSYPTACAVVVPQPSTTNIPVGSSILVGWNAVGQVSFGTEAGSSTVLNYKNKAVTSTATPSGASIEFTGACPQQFAESWNNGLTGYSQSPYGLFTIASQTPYGNVLQFAGGASGNQNGIYGKSFTSISVNRIEFKFRLLSVTGTSANGTPNISFLNGSTGPIIAPKANTLYDALGRIQVNLGGGVVYLGSGPPALNVWYRVRISYLAGAGNSFVDVTDLSNGGTFGSVQWAGDGAAGITVNTLNFTNPGSTSNDAGVQFDDIFMYNCASTITTTTGAATAKIDQKFGKVRLIKVAADEWDLDGDLATS